MNERLHYESYMHFSCPEEDPWDSRLISGYINDLIDDPDVQISLSDQDVESILFCYDQSLSHRVYHGPDHGGFVGQPEVPDVLAARLSDRYTLAQAKATLALAGLFHDVAYKHVDAIDEMGTRAWPTVLREMIGGMADYSVTTVDGKLVYTTTLTEEGEQDAVTQMVAHVFDVGEAGIAHNQGGNEFDSALAAAKFLEGKGVPPKHIIAVTAAIAATVPFKPAVEIGEQGVVTDGHMEKLAKNVKSARLTASGVTYQPDWQDTNDMMLLSVHLANRDIASFIRRDNFADVVNGGRGIKREELAELRIPGETTIRRLARAASIERSAPFLYQGLGGGEEPVPAAYVPHLYIPRDDEGASLGIEAAYPPKPVYDEAVANVERNARMASDFFKAHEVGITLVAAIATLIGVPDASVPGIVDASRWHRDARPQGEVFENLSSDEILVYKELMYGINQTDIDTVTPHQSPVGGMVHGAVGSEGIAKLSGYIKDLRAAAKDAGNLDPFSDPVAAKAYVETVVSYIGPRNFEIIMKELDRVARYYVDDPRKGDPHRMASLETVRRELVL